MKKIILSLILLPYLAMGAGLSGFGTSYLRLEPSTLPTICRLGDMRTDTSSGLIKYCNGSNTWTSLSGFLNPMTTGGDLIFGGASGVATRLANGTAGYVLTSNGTTLAPSWQAAGTASPLTTKGDLYGFSTVNARLPVGSDTQVLTADSTQALGVKWAPVSGSGTSTPTANTNAQWDANKNMSANNLVPGFQSIATAGGTTTFTVASPGITAYTGTLNQTAVLPVVSTLPQTGLTYQIQNYSTGTISVQSSGGNSISAIPPNAIMFFTANALTGTTASVWNASVLGGLTETVNIPNVTPFVSYTPTFTGMGTASSINVKWRQVGDSYQIHGTFTAGSTTSTAFSMTLPNAATIDVSKTGGDQVFVVGQIATSQGTISSAYPSGSNGPVSLFVDTATNSSVIYAGAATSSGLWVKMPASNLFGTGFNITIDFTVPIVGLATSTSLNVLGGGGFVQPTISKVGASSHSGAFPANNTGNYTAPANVAYIKVRAVGGGGGGSGAGTSGAGAGGSGSATTFGTSLLSAGGGIGAAAANFGGAGGTPTILSPAIGTPINGGMGQGSAQSGTGNFAVGGAGGDAPYFSGGGKSSNIGVGTATAGQTDTGGCGQGGVVTAAAASNNAGSGGGSGGVVDAIIVPTAGQVFAYTVGAGGFGGTAGSSGGIGGAGGSGYIEVTEYYYNGAIGTATNVTGVVAVANGGTGKATARCIAAYTGSGTTYTATQRIQFNTSVYDNCSAVTTGASWVFTVPAGHDGLYKMTAHYYQNAGSGAGARLVINSVNKQYTAISTTNITADQSAVYPLSAGDTVYWNANGNLVMDTTDPLSSEMFIEQMN